MRIAGNFNWTSSITLDFGWGDPHTPAFLGKCAEAADWKGVVKYSRSKERQESAKESGRGVSKMGKRGWTERKGEKWRGRGG
jgi:hypothetical protein